MLILFVFTRSACSVVSTLAGGGPTSSGFTSFADGSGTQAAFLYAPGIAIDAFGNVLVADLGNHRIRRMAPSGGTDEFDSILTLGLFVHMKWFLC